MGHWNTEQENWSALLLRTQVSLENDGARHVVARDLFAFHARGLAG